MIADRDDDTAESSPVGTARAVPVVRFSIRDLLGTGREAIIEHNGAEYRLRITAKGRLILTK